MTKVNIQEKILDLVKIAEDASEGNWHATTGGEVYAGECAGGPPKIIEGIILRDDLMYVLNFQPRNVLVLLQALEIALNGLEFIAPEDGVTMSGPGLSKAYEKRAEKALSEIQKRLCP